MMAACVRTWILQLCVFTKIFLLITAQTEHMTNVAVSKPCNISSQYVEGHSSNDCSAAINNNTGTIFVTELSSQNCIHTNNNDVHPTWSVDLGQNIPVHRITIYGRDTYGRRMACVQVLLDGREIYTFPCPGAANVITDIPVNPPERGRVVSITKDRDSHTNLEEFLNICEIQIWVCSIGWWGSDCQNQCNCQDKDNYCDPQSGSCSKTNVAVNKPCNISSQYVENGLSNDCTAAINGKTSTTFVLYQTSQNCIHTSLSDFHPSWSVNLGQNFSVRSITIYGRDTLARRMDCVQVFLDGRQLYKFPCPGTTNVITDITLNPAQRGQVVRVTNDQKSDDDPAPFLNICEVQIWVCSKGWWGSDCQNQCSCQGKDYYCDPDNGKCSKECSTGYWGDHCSNICGRGCKNGDCNVYNGTCQCKSGWAAPSCDDCSDGHYNMSNKCQNTCGNGCHDTCSKTNGTCQCQTGWQPPLCQVCSSGYWGENCTACGAGCSNACDVKTGSCSCTNGWTGPLCTECSTGHWGDNCSHVCGRGCKNGACNVHNGTCECKLGWAEPSCDVCSDGHYNPSNDCQNTCGEGCNNTCSRTDGTCQCQTGWQPPLCQDCSVGHYNVSNDCNNTCSQGCNDTCSRTDGTCQCRPGWDQSLCQNCVDGHYNESNDCQNTCGKGCNNTCNRTDGVCQCRLGWESPLCTNCENGHYNVSNDCQNTCGEGCNGTCSRTDGTCHCRPEWQPPLCQHCANGHYNVSNDCQNTCSEGCNNTCSRTDGTCQCKQNWDPPLCQEKMQFRGDESSPAPVGAVVGPVVAVILVAGAVVLIVIVWRRRQYKGNQRMPQTSQFEVPKDIQHQLLTEYPGNESPQEGVVNVTVASDNKPVVPVKPQTYAKLVDTIDDKHVYNNETPANDQRNSALTSPRSSEAGNGDESAEKTNENNSPKKDKNKRDSKPPPVAQKPVAKTENAANMRLYENVDLVKNSWKISENGENQNTPTKSEEKDQEAVNGVDEEGEDIYNTEDIYGSYRSMGSSSILDDFQKSLLARLASGKLGIEFAEFPKDMQHLCKVGSKPENSKKNRFKALCAYDHSRVVLRRPKGDNNTDYVNASYIKGCRREKAYIATQGPRSNTVDDFWWMVWQENTTQIVMLTNIKEGGKDKCEEYWPPVGNAKTYGHVTVTALKTDTRADFVVRSFVVGTKKDGDQRTVSQYHYLVWPDHGVPSTLSLVNFWRYVKARAQGAIPVVHCSAGVGRTGTYIALDIASDLRSRGRDVNVKEIVSGLREDRTLMVQTEAQYKFLHEAILEEYSSRATRINFELFDNIFPDTIDINTKSKVDKEFKILSQMGMFVPRPKYTAAASKENMPKNRNRESLPDDGHLVYIPGHMPGRNQYINAVYMSSLRKRRGLILTQLPLPDTVVDMWRLIDGWNINTVVSLGHKDQKKSVKNYCRYWPETEQDALKTKQHTIGLTSTAALGDHLTCYDLSLTTKESRDRSVRVLYYDDWAGQVPGKISDILHLIDTLESWHVEEDTSPVVVQCSDGVTRSGMFCALYDVINRARIDQEVDVYLPVRQVQTVRPKAFTTEMQYRYCYQAVQEYKRQDSVYQNM